MCINDRGHVVPVAGIIQSPMHSPNSNEISYPRHKCIVTAKRR